MRGGIIAVIVFFSFISSVYAQQNKFSNSIKRSVATESPTITPEEEVSSVSAQTQKLQQQTIVQLNAVEKYLERLRIRVETMEGIDEDVQGDVLNAVERELTWVQQGKSSVTEATSEEALEELRSGLQQEWVKRSQVRIQVNELARLAHFKTLYDKVAEIYALAVTPMGEDNENIIAMKQELDDSLQAYRRARESFSSLNSSLIRKEMKAAYGSLLQAVDESEHATKSAR